MTNIVIYTDLPEGSKMREQEKLDAQKSLEIFRREAYYMRFIKKGEEHEDIQRG